MALIYMMQWYGVDMYDPMTMMLQKEYFIITVILIEETCMVNEIQKNLILS